MCFQDAQKTQLLNLVATWMKPQTPRTHRELTENSQNSSTVPSNDIGRQRLLYFSLCFFWLLSMQALRCSESNDQWEVHLENHRKNILMYRTSLSIQYSHIFTSSSWSKFSRRNCCSLPSVWTLPVGLVPVPLAAAAAFAFWRPHQKPHLFNLFLYLHDFSVEVPFISNVNNVNKKTHNS